MDLCKYFDLIVLEGYETEVLQIFTLDIIEELIEKANRYSLEIVNNNFYIYARGTIENRDELYQIYNLACYFIDKLGPKIIKIYPDVKAMKQHIKY